MERAPTGMVQVAHENDWQTDPDILCVSIATIYSKTETSLCRKGYWSKLNSFSLQVVKLVLKLYPVQTQGM